MSICIKGGGGPHALIALREISDMMTTNLSSDYFEILGDDVVKAVEFLEANRLHMGHRPALTASISR